MTTELSATELFAIIGEQVVQLRLAQQRIDELKVQLAKVVNDQKEKSSEK